MANVSYAIREDPSTIFLLEDAGNFYKDYCQICSFGKYLVRPELLGQYMGFAPYIGYNGKYRGDPSKIKLSIEDKDQLPAYDYVAVIDSQVEFRVTPSVIRLLSKDHMPAWGMKSYLDFFSDQKSGIILFLRVYRISEAIDSEYIKKGSRGSSQILKLYDQNEEETALSVDIKYPVISDNKFDYIREEIIHLLKVENAFIAGYDRSSDGLESLQKRIEAEHLVQGTRQRWELRNMQWVEAGYDIEGDFDMAQLDYESIYREVLEIEPGMESIINYIRQVQPARLGEYDYLLKDVHEHNENERPSTLRIFDMSVRSAVKNALYYHKRYGLDLEDSFQCACIGVFTAIQKHNDGVEGLFPSYASMWMRQIMDRDMPMYQYNFRFPVHFKAFVIQMMNRIKKQVGDFNLMEIGYEELYHLLDRYADLKKDKILFMTNSLFPSVSIEQIIGTSEEEIYFAKEDKQLESLEHSLSLEFLTDCLSELKDREREIIEKRYGFYDYKEMSLEEISKDYDLTRERVRQIQAKAERKIIKRLELKGIITKEQFDKIMSIRNKGKSREDWEPKKRGRKPKTDNQSDGSEGTC